MIINLIVEENAFKIKKYVCHEHLLIQNVQQILYSRIRGHQTASKYQVMLLTSVIM